MPTTDLDRALEAFRNAERAMGAERRKDAKGLAADKGAAAQAKREAAHRVKEAADAADRTSLPERQRRDVKRALDYLRLSAQAKPSSGAEGAA